VFNYNVSHDMDIMGNLGKSPGLLPSKKEGEVKKKHK
jgi:hypothetical protein